jgi:hypothetical protein
LLEWWLKALRNAALSRAQADHFLSMEILQTNGSKRPSLALKLGRLDEGIRSEGHGACRP